MKISRRLIRKIIVESACNHVNKKISSGIDAMKANNLIISIDRSYNSLRIEVYDDITGKVSGYIEASKSFQLKCTGAYIVSNAEVEEGLRNLGIGALLYDVAIEIAGKNGLASDRSALSEDAERMWFYFNYNDDYDFKAFDTPDGRFTKDYYDDDCYAEPYLSYEGYDDYQDDFRDHAFNKAFFKKNLSQSTLGCLAENGLIDEYSRGYP